MLASFLLGVVVTNMLENYGKAAIPWVTVLTAFALIIAVWRVYELRRLIKGNKPK